MTLLTPPRTSHRDRDHRLPVARVAWSQQNQYFILSASPKELAPLPARVLDPPCKSILKKTSQCFLPVPEEKDHRDITPEPEDPLVNLTYLVRPVAQVINRDSSLSDLIEAYSILNARIRAGVASSSDSDASWPLFQPLRKHTQAFVDAVMRDLGRALVDPSSDTMVDEGLIAECKGERENEQAASLLPSPQHSPKKKKKGMSATQVKWARDLCTVTHVVLRLLSVVFVLPSVYQLFSGNGHLIFTCRFSEALQRSNYMTCSPMSSLFPWQNHYLPPMLARLVHCRSGSSRCSGYLKECYFPHGTELHLLCVVVWRANLARKAKRAPPATALK